MKKFLLVMMLGMFALTLAACKNTTDIPPQILDCIENPDDPACDPTVVDCLINPDDPACEEDPVYCTVTPDDPACEEEPVDCTVTPDDPACEEDPVDCTVTPDDPECPPIDTRTPAEIVADAIAENWDGTMDHVDIIMNMLDTSDSMQMEFEYNVEILNEYGDTQSLNTLVVDNYTFGTYTIIHREVTLTVDEDVVEFDLILEEKDNGLNIYYNTSFLRSIIAEDANTEIQEVLDTLDANETWFLFRFDDSLANLVEFEILKEMMIAAFVQEFGEDFFYLLQDELELEIGFDFGMYGVDLGLFVDHLVAEDFAAAELLLQGIDVPGMVLGLDLEFLVPEIVFELNFRAADILILDPTFVVADHIAYLELNGTEAWLNSLTEAEITTLLALIDPQISLAYEAYLIGELDHFLVMEFLNDPEVQLGLADIPGLDVAAFTATMDALDYDAMYMEYVDGDLLAQAIYEGQVAYDLFMIELAITAPQTASVLVHFSGLVLELEPTFVEIDALIVEIEALIADLEYGFENLVMFEQYFNVEYYLDNDILYLDIDVTDDFGILTTITLDNSETTALFTDVMDDLYWYLDGFETFEMPYVEILNCPAGEVCDSFPEYAEILADLAQLGNIEVTVLYDPMNPGEVTTKVQFEDLLNSLVLMDNPTSNAEFIDFSFSQTVREDGAVTVPTVYTDVNQTVEDFAKFSLILTGYDYLEQVAEYYAMYPAELTTDFGTTKSLAYFNLNGLSMAFDHNLSEITIGGNIISGPEFSIELYWLDGTEVFDAPIGLAELLTVVGPGTGAPDRVDYLFFLDLVNDDNFHMTKLFLVYLWQDNYEEPIV